MGIRSAPSSYLVGLALGSLLSLKFQETVAVIATSGACGLCSCSKCGRLCLGAHGGQVGRAYRLDLPIVVVAAALLGAALPLICHFAIPADENAGARLSYLYLGNIIGSGVGSLFTGFWLMDTMTLGEISIVLAVLGIGMALGVAYLSGVRGKNLAFWSTLGTLAAVAVLWSGASLFSGLYERLQLKKEYTPDAEFALVVESRFGVITIDENRYIYGGGVYDGYLGTELNPSSWMVRPCFVRDV